MAYTNAQVVRREIGDGGTLSRDTQSGNGATTDYFLSGAPLLASPAALVYVAGVLKTIATDYTLDVETGRLVFVVAPASGTDNIEIIYRSCEVSDGDITEALRLVGLTDTATADLGPVAAVLQAGAMLSDWVYSKLAYDYDITKDGESLSRSQAATAWKDRASTLFDRSRRAGGIVPIEMVKLDGYNYNEVSSRDVLTTNVNVRRRFYGDQDVLP